MKNIKYLLIVLGLASSGLTYAECSVDLPYPQLMDCIVEEGASDRYRPVENEPAQVSDTKPVKNDSGEKLTFAVKGKKIN